MFQLCPALMGTQWGSWLMMSSSSIEIWSIWQHHNHTHNLSPDRPP